MGPRVSRAWALRELCTWGCRAITAALDGGAVLSLRAPHPRRGPPRKAASGSKVPPTAEEFTTIAPVIVPRSLLDELRALVPRVARATGQHATVAMVVREVLLLGYEARTEARRAAERAASDQRSVLRRLGYPVSPDIEVVGVGVITPYLPPGQRSGVADEWSAPPKGSPRTRKATPTAKKPAPKGAGTPRKRPASAAHGSGRRTPRRRAPSKRSGPSSSKDDDEPDVLVQLATRRLAGLSTHDPFGARR